MNIYILKDTKKNLAVSLNHLYLDELIGDLIENYHQARVSFDDCFPDKNNLSQENPWINRTVGIVYLKFEPTMNDFYEAKETFRIEQWDLADYES